MRERERERELCTGILFEEPNPEREPPKRPNWARQERAKEQEQETPTGEREQQGRGGRQGRHCGEANPNQKLGCGTGILFEEPNPEREPPKRPNWSSDGE